VPEFQEMYPNRAENYCCTGGGGAMSMSEYTPRRLKSAKVKADQLRATGASVVVTSCHNCVDGLNDLIKHYKLDMKVTQLVNLVADALVLPARVEPAKEKELVLAGRKIVVVDDEPDTRTFLSTVLGDNGAKVIEVSDSADVLKTVKAEKPDVILTGLSRPINLESLFGLAANNMGIPLACAEDIHRSRQCWLRCHSRKPILMLTKFTMNIA